MILCISANFQLSGVLTPSALFCAFFTIASFHVNSFSERKNHRSEKLWMVCQRFTPVLWWYTVREPKGIDTMIHIYKTVMVVVSPKIIVQYIMYVLGIGSRDLNRFQSSENLKRLCVGLISCTISTMSKTNHLYHP